MPDATFFLDMHVTGNIIQLHPDETTSLVAPRSPESLGFFCTCIMDKVAFFIDGFNLYHSLHDYPRLHKYKWLDIKKLCNCFITKKQEIASIKYFTTYPHWKPESCERHRLYVRALRSVDIEIIFGKFKRKKVRCHLCGKTFKSHEEKQTDVNIGINLLLSAVQNEYDTAMLVSGDSDLIPAIQMVESHFAHKTVVVVSPIGRKTKELTEIADLA